jgi:hypothetical protein
MTHIQWQYASTWSKWQVTWLKIFVGNIFVDEAPHESFYQMKIAQITVYQKYRKWY